MNSVEFEVLLQIVSVLQDIKIKLSSIEKRLEHLGRNGG